MVWAALLCLGVRRQKQWRRGALPNPDQTCAHPAYQRPIGAQRQGKRQ